MPRLLMVVSTGYDAEEMLTPHRKFVERDVEVVVAAPDGARPQPDPHSLEAQFHYAVEDKDFAASVLRSLALGSDDIHLSLHHLTRLNLMTARRVFLGLREAGLSIALARALVENSAGIACREDRDFLDVLAAEPVVAARLTVERLHGIAEELSADAAAESRRVAQALAAIEGLQQPRNLSEISDAEILTFDGVFFPGGQGAMVDLADNADVAYTLGLLHERGRTVATLGHGSAALLSAGEGHEGRGWVFAGFKMAAFTDNGDAVWAPHVVVDRNLVTAQNPASSEAAADAVLKNLGVF